MKILEAMEGYVDTNFPELDSDNFNPVRNAIAIEQISADLERTLDGLLLIAGKTETLLSQETISLEEFNNFKENLTYLNTGYDIDQNIFSVALESQSDPRLALEGVMDTVKAIFGRIGKALKQIITHTYDTIRYDFGIIDKTVERIEKLHPEISKLSSSKKGTIHLKVTQQLRYGDSEVPENIKEYNKRLKESVDAAYVIMSTIDKFTTEARFSSLKTLLSFVPVGFDTQGWFKKNFGFILDFDQSMKKIPGLIHHDVPPRGIRKDLEFYSTPIYLGMWDLEYGSDKHLDNAEKLDRWEKSWSILKIIADIDWKVRSKGSKTSVTYENVTKGDLENLYRTLSTIISQYQDHARFSRRFFNMLNADRHLAISSSLAGPGVYLTILSARLKAALATVRIISSLNASIYTITKDQLNMAREILEKGIRGVS